MGDRSYRQPFHARKEKGMQQPTPLNRLKAGQSNDSPAGNGPVGSQKNSADSQANKGDVKKLGTPYKI